MTSDTVSVLMATYPGDNSERFARALESIFSQVLPVRQFVLVVIGLIGSEQQTIAARYASDPRIDDVRVLRLSCTVRLPDALNIGLDACTGTWIMCMGSENEAVLDRSAVQLDYVRAHPVDLVGGWSEEIRDDQSSRVLATPTTHEAIVKALVWRNILVYSGILVRTETLRAVGGYSTRYPQLADWDLFVRLALAQARFAVIPKVLIRILAGKEQAARRRGLHYLRHEVRFRTYCWACGFINFRQYALSTLGYAAYRLIDAGIVSRSKEKPAIPH